jgi:hypothetical protein
LADLINTLVGRGLKADLGNVEAGRTGEGRLHLVEAGVNLREFRDERGIEVNDVPAACAQLGRYALEQDLRVDVFEGRIGVGEKMADVGEGGGTEQRVANRVGQAVKCTPPRIIGRPLTMRWMS